MLFGRHLLVWGLFEGVATRCGSHIVHLSMLLLLPIHAWSAGAQLLLLLLLRTLDREITWWGLGSTDRRSCDGRSRRFPPQWVHILVFGEHVAFIHLSPWWVLGRIGWRRQGSFQTNTFGVHNNSIWPHLMSYLIGIILSDHHLAWAFVVQAFLLEYLRNW